MPDIATSPDGIIHVLDPDRPAWQARTLCGLPAVGWSKAPGLAGLPGLTLECEACNG